MLQLPVVISTSFRSVFAIEIWPESVDQILFGTLHPLLSGTQQSLMDDLTFTSAFLHIKTAIDLMYIVIGPHLLFINFTLQSL